MKNWLVLILSIIVLGGCNDSSYSTQEDSFVEQVEDSTDVEQVEDSTDVEQVEDSTEDFIYFMCGQNSELLEAVTIARLEGKPMSEMVDLLRESRKKNTSDDPKVKAFLDDLTKILIQATDMIYSLPKPKNEKERVSLIEEVRDGVYRGCIKQLLNISRGLEGK